MRLGTWTGVVVVALVAAALPASQASPLGLDTHVVTSEQPGGYDYLVPEVVADVDGTLVLINADLRAHDVVSVADHPTGDAPWCERFHDRACPLFASELIGLGEQSAVAGIDALSPLASYEFYCSTHAWMRGTLHTI